MIKKVEIGWRQGEKTGTIPVSVRYSGRRTLGLEIQADGTVIVRAPRNISREALMRFLEQRQEWVVEKWFLVQERKAARESQPKKDYEENPALEAEYRKKALETLRARAEYFAEQMGVSYSSIKVGAAKTRWGRCSGKGNLNFHWKLILMPPEILDYVVVHELAHRKEMNQSPRFWSQVEMILPDYRSRRKWLRDFGGMV